MKPMKKEFTETNEENEEEMFHSDPFVSFVVFCRSIFHFSIPPH
jgi:hypothetical protein